jgi:sensor domain CHASE-containing protein
MPLDGILAFPDGPYMVSARPILTSQRTGASRGILRVAAKFDESSVNRVSDLTSIAVGFERLDAPNLPADFQRAILALHENNEDFEVQPLSQDSIAGYTILPDVFGDSLLVMRVDTRRPIYSRGKLTQLYLFGALLGGAILSSLVIIFFLQKFVLSGSAGSAAKSAHWQAQSH